jgi:phage terminase large subunit
MFLKLQVRSSEALLKPLLGVRLTANPLGKYADWVKRRFVDPCREGFKVITEVIETSAGDVIRDRVFIPATLRDNPHLPKEYEAELMSAPEHLRRAFLDGDWDVTPGSFFGDIFDPKIHVIDDLGPTEIRIPSNWQVFRAGDWGARAPAACYWLAVDNDGLLIVLDELYGPGEEATLWSTRVLAVEEKWGWAERREGVRYPISKLEGYLDPAAFASHDGPPVSEKAFEIGVNWFPADNERKAGWAEIRRRLMERGGVGGKIPGLRITRRCTNLIRTLPNLTSPENDGVGDMDDIDSKQEDHAADALRYGCMSRPIVRTKGDLEDAEIKRWERIYLGRDVRDGMTEAAGRSPITGY